MTATAQSRNIQASVAQDLSTVVVDDTRFEISAKGKVTIFSDTLTAKDVQRKPAEAANATQGRQVAIERNGFTVNGVKVEFLPEGGFAVHTNSPIQVSLATPLEIGEVMEDGSVFAGLTTDGKNNIFVTPKDLPVKGSFNKLSEALAKLNWNFKHGHNDWQIGSVAVMQVVRENLAEGPLKGSFKTALHRDRYHPEYILPRRAPLYATSTENSSYRSEVATVRFADGGSRYSPSQLTRMKLHTLKLRLLMAFDKKHAYPNMPVRYNTQGYKSGSVKFESKNHGQLNCRPVRLERVPVV